MDKFKKTQDNLKGLSIEELLEEIVVIEPGLWESYISDKLEWWAVSTDLGIIAYFGSEGDALRFRLDYINRLINP